MKYPSKVQILEEESGDYKAEKFGICGSCNQEINKVVITKGQTKLMAHNRKVFVRMKKDGTPDWFLQACPGGN